MKHRNVSYAVELNDTYIIGHGGRLEAVDNLRGLKGDVHLFTDLQGAITKTMAVESDIRYAELMISRKLQEDGEFDEPAFVIPHWKKKRSKNVTDICFTALPSKRYFQYLEQVGRHRAHMVVMPLQSLLWDVLRRQARRKPAAVVFQHDRFADLIIGTRQRVWYAGRAVAFDDTDAQIQSLWHTVAEDIRTVGDEQGQPVETLYVVTWIDSKLPDLWPEGDFAVVILETEEVRWEGRSFQVSLPGLIQAGRARPVLAPLKEKVFYGARRMLPYLNGAFLLAAVLCMAAGGWYRHRGDQLQAQLDQVQNRAALIRAKVPERPASVTYEATLSHVDRIRTSRLLPTYGQVLRDFAIDGDSGLRLADLKADYADAAVRVDAFGTIDEPFETAYKAYRSLLLQLERRGYRVVEERFDTQIRNSHFTLQAVKEVG